MPRTWTHDDGYLLIELLVAMVVLALLTVAVFSGVRFGSRAWGHADRQRTETADMAAIHSILHDAIARAYPEFATNILTDHSIAFDGELDSLTLVAPLPAAIEAGVLARERFFVAQDGQGRPAFFMAWHLDLPAADGSPALPDRRVELADDVRQVTFAYFGSPVPGRQGTWSERWVGLDHLPDLVRFRIEFADPARPAWPDLVVDPKISTNVACLYDPADTRCRRTQ